jgi:hypothetical protein
MPSDLKGFAWPHGRTPKQILKRFNKFLEFCGFAHGGPNALNGIRFHR